MITQAEKIKLELNNEGWNIKKIERPSSNSYWWLWELWTMQKGDRQMFLSFLIDPQSEKSESNVWAVSANKTEPNERLEAEKGLILTLSSGWESGLTEFIANIRNTYNIN